MTSLSCATSATSRRAPASRIDELLALGRAEGVDGFGLTPLALRLSRAANGVSELHGEVAREMWAPLWPGEEPRIGHVTNGVHLGTWLAPELEQLLRDVGVRPEAPPDEGNWDAATTLDNDAFWAVHAGLKERLAALTGFDTERLTIGFARRFATYKRAGLVFSDLERLLELPVQIVVAGKAHPQDAGGKDVMQRIVELSRDPAVAGRVVFLENYDLDLARAIIPGCDIWLNTPRRPYEASGTSGMKAAVNGVPNLSVLDGWWAEAYDAGARLGARGHDRRGGRRAALPRARGAGRAALRVAGRLGRADEELDRAARPTLLDAARGDRVRRAVLPAGDGARSRRLTGQAPSFRCSAPAAPERRRAARAAPSPSSARRRGAPGSAAGARRAARGPGSRAGRGGVRVIHT